MFEGALNRGPQAKARFGAGVLLSTALHAAALDARVEGMTIVKCVIPKSGIPERCRIIKPLPYLDEAVLGAISTWRYRPATLDGVPVAVDYVLRMQVQLPR